MRQRSLTSFTGAAIPAFSASCGQSGIPDGPLSATDGDTQMTGDVFTWLRNLVRASPAIPPGEIWLQAECSWAKTRPEFPHGALEWRVAGMCVHEHLERVLLCAGCKTIIDRWQNTEMVVPAPWCAQCYRMRPGGHHCEVSLKIERL